MAMTNFFSPLHYSQQNSLSKTSRKAQGQVPYNNSIFAFSLDSKYYLNLILESEKIQL